MPTYPRTPRRLLASCLTLAAGLHDTTQARDLYLSPAGNDAWSGRLPEPNPAGTDGPLRTFERARDAIQRPRNVRQWAIEPAAVHIRGGVYVRGVTFELTSADSGFEGARVTWHAWQGEPVQIIGGRQITRWSPITDPAIRDRIQSQVRDQLRQADLRAHGLTDFGKMRSRGFGRPLQPAPLELFFGGKPMTLARWPNAGEWATISAVPDGQKGAKFTCTSAPMQRWKTIEDLWVHGLWTYDWADSYEKVAAIDPARSEFTTAPPHGVYGYTAGKRFYAVNLIEELDEPGEYYVDTRAGKIYFLPPGPLESNETWVSTLEDPMIRLTSTHYVNIEGLTLECTRGNAVEMIGGAHNTITRCTLRNIGSLAIRIADPPPASTSPASPPLYSGEVGGGSLSVAPTQNGVHRCEIYDCGEGGIELDGGDRKTLTPGGNFVTNCRIYRFQRSCHTYRMAVHLHGVGQRVVHNEMFDAPHTAVLINGNEHVIEYNQFHHLCTQTGDAAAFYIGRDLTQRGNIVRYNYFHDLQGVKGQKGFTDVMGVYLDDCTCGTTVLGNVFRNVSRALVLGGGRDNIIDNNIFLDCPIAIHVDARATSWAKFWFDGRDNTLIDRLKAVNYNQPPYSKKYPELVNILEDQPAVPKGNRITRNICTGGGKWLELLDNLTETLLNIRGNYIGPDPGFVDSARGDFALKSGGAAGAIGFQPIPFEKIGPGGPKPSAN